MIVYKVKSNSEEKTAYSAEQFSKTVGSLLVKLGYFQLDTKTLVVSASCPRSMNFRRCFVIETSKGLKEIVDSDWIVTNLVNNKVKVYTDEKFQKKFSENYDAK